MDPIIALIAASGWIAALGVLVTSMRIDARRRDEAARGTRLRFMAREFLRAAREIEDLVYSGENPRSPNMTKATSLMRLAFFDLSIDAPPEIVRAADRYRDEIIRYVTDYVDGREEGPGDRAARSACQEHYARAVEMRLRLDDLEERPGWLSAALSRNGG